MPARLGGGGFQRIEFRLMRLFVFLQAGEFSRPDLQFLPCGIELRVDLLPFDKKDTPFGPSRQERLPLIGTRASRERSSGRAVQPQSRRRIHGRT